MAKKNKKAVSGFDYTRELRRYPLILDREEIAQLVETWRTYEDEDVKKTAYVRQMAYDQLVYGNYRLVFSVARQFVNRGMDLFDLRQEGFIGLERALKTFDPKKGKLSTYATLWIREKIIRALADKARTIRITVHTETKMFFINRFVHSFYDEYKRLPTNQEAYDRIHALDGTDNETVVGKNITMKNVQFCRILQSTGDEYSLDTPIRRQNGDEGMALGDVIADPRVNVETIVEVKRLLKAALERVKYRTHRNAQLLTILHLRFELGQKLEEVGRRVGLTRTRIGQIEKKFVTKIAQDLNISYKGAREILTELPLGIEKEQLITPENVLPKKFSTSHLFKILCEHLIFTPSEQRIVKEPLRTLQIRKELQLLPNEAETALQKMQAAGLIQGEAPWTIIHILPNIPIPQFKN